MYEWLLLLMSRWPLAWKPPVYEVSMMSQSLFVKHFEWLLKVEKHCRSIYHL